MIAGPGGTGLTSQLLRRVKGQPTHLGKTLCWNLTERGRGLGMYYHLVGFSHNIHKAHGSIPSSSYNRYSGPHRNPTTWQVEAGGSEVQGHPQLHSKFKASLGYMKPSFSLSFGVSLGYMRC